MATFTKANLIHRTAYMLETKSAGSSNDWLIEQWKTCDSVARRAILDGLWPAPTATLCEVLGSEAIEWRRRWEHKNRERRIVSAISDLAKRLGPGNAAAIAGIVGAGRQASGITFPLPDLKVTKCKLPVYGVKRQVALERKARLGAFDPKRGFASAAEGDPTVIEFTGWELFHATKKSELAGSFTAEDSERKAWAMALDQYDLFVWNSGDLRLRRGGVLATKDASRTYFAGRFAEGVLHLLMMEKDYIFWDHIPSLCDRAWEKAEIEHKERIRRATIIKASHAQLRANKRRGRGLEKRASSALREPDFAFEKADGKVALAESKGSFAKYGTRATSKIKPVLASALEQVDTWKGLLEPAPERSFAVATFWREVKDGTPSLVAVVDPDDGNRQQRPVEIHGGDIRRGHYSALLRGMGLEESARALREWRAIEPQPRTFPTLRVGNHTFAIVPSGGSCTGPLGLSLLTAFDVVGVEIAILKALSHAVTDPADSLARIEPIRRLAVYPDHAANEDRAGVFEGSIFPDGSLLGRAHDPTPFGEPVTVPI
jgi:hypothetical protein